MSSQPSARFPFSPYPAGWYAQCFSRELPASGVITRRFAGREVCSALNVVEKLAPDAPRLRLLRGVKA